VKRCYYLLTCLVLLGLLFVSRGFWLTRLAEFLIVSDKLVPADVIVVLAGDGNGERVDEGAKLYQVGYAPRILMSGGPLAWHLTCAEWMKKQAVFLGVPARVLVLEAQSRSTLENAKFSLPILAKLQTKSVILVTSPTHTRRAKWVFERVLRPAQIKVYVVPARASEFKLSCWWTRHEDIQLVVWEYVSLVYYLLRGD